MSCGSSERPKARSDVNDNRCSFVGSFLCLSLPCVEPLVHGMCLPCQRQSSLVFHCRSEHKDFPCPTVSLLAFKQCHLHLSRDCTLSDCGCVVQCDMRPRFIALEARLASSAPSVTYRTATEMALNSCTASAMAFIRGRQTMCLRTSLPRRSFAQAAKSRERSLALALLGPPSFQPPYDARGEHCVMVSQKLVSTCSSVRTSSNLHGAPHACRFATFGLQPRVSLHP